MQHGDLSNVAAPRLIFVFEGTLATLSPSSAKRYGFYSRTHQWKRAAYEWELDLQALRYLNDLAYRHDLNIDIATFLDPRESEHVRTRLDNASYPYGHFIETTVEDLARIHGNFPNVAAIYDFDPARSFTYGAKGRTEMKL